MDGNPQQKTHLFFLTQIDKNANGESDCFSAFFEVGLGLFRGCFSDLPRVIFGHFSEEINF